MIQDILKSCGYPTDVMVLDCETYFDGDYTLNKLSTYGYVTDPRFEILGWAVKRGNESAKFVHTLHEPDIDWKRTTIVMHNAKFDALVLALRYQIFPPFIVDTLDLARHLEPRWNNKLEVLCKRHGLPDKDDTSHKGMHETDFSLELWEKLIRYAENDANLTYDLLRILLPKLSNPAFELEIARYTRDLFIRPTLCLNTDRAGKLVEKMQAEIQTVCDQTSMTGTQLRSGKFFEAQMREAMPGEEPPMKIGKKGLMLAIAKTDPGYSYLLGHPVERVRQLMEARVAVKSWPVLIKRIGKMCSMARAAGDRMPIPLKYCGAHTGRFSGAEGVNPQNFTARGHPLANVIRTLIEAPDGYTLIISDFSQIEARVLDWLAGQGDMVQAFAEGQQIYANFASRLTGHRVRKPKKTDSKVVAAWHGNYRQMGKIGILGCGYGMGVDKCMDYAKNTYKIDLTYAMAQQIIDLYRKTHAQVVKFWYEVERVFRLATLNTTQTYTLPHGLRFFRDEDATVIELPSTRRLYYIGARVGGTTRYPQLAMPLPKSPSKTLPMWGGYLVENIVQAVSRDILAETILKVEQLGVRVPMTVHDDLSVLVPESKAEMYLTQIEDIARIPPAWAAGLPLDIESKISREYVK